MKISKTLKVLATAAVFSVSIASVRASADQDLAHYIGKGVMAGYHGTKWTLKKLDEGSVKTIIVVKNGVVYGADKTLEGGEIAYSKGLKPVVVSPVVELSRLTVVDGVYKVGFEPIGKGLEATGKNDVVTGVQVYGSNVSEGAQAFASRTVDDATKVYSVTVVPVGDGLRKTGHGIVRVSCETVNSFKTTPKTCSKPKVSSVMEAE